MYTLVEIFQTGGNISTPVEIFTPRLKYVYLGGNISTPVEIFSPGWELKKIIVICGMP